MAAMSYAVAADLAEVRAYVRASALALGLPDRRCDLLVLAVSELTTNTVQYTRSAGRVRVWADDAQVICDVVDTGPIRSFGPMPPPDATRGRGLAIVHRVADEVTATPTAEGTLVRIRMNL
jgi:serine/threonine-protein kinase RsbW